MWQRVIILISVALLSCAGEPTDPPTAAGATARAALFAELGDHHHKTDQAAKVAADLATVRQAADVELSSSALQVASRR